MGLPISAIKRWALAGVIAIQLPLGAITATAAFAAGSPSPSPSVSASADPSPSTAASSPAASASGSASASSSSSAAGTTPNGTALQSGDIVGQIFSVLMNVVLRIALLAGTAAIVFNGIRMEVHSMTGDTRSVSHVLQMIMTASLGLVLVVLAPNLVNGLGVMLSSFWHPQMYIPQGYCANPNITAC